MDPKLRTLGISGPPPPPPPPIIQYSSHRLIIKGFLQSSSYCFFFVQKQNKTFSKILTFLFFKVMCSDFQRIWPYSNSFISGVFCVRDPFWRGTPYHSKSVFKKCETKHDHFLELVVISPPEILWDTGFTPEMNELELIKNLWNSEHIILKTKKVRALSVGGLFVHQSLWNWTEGIPLSRPPT